MKVIKLKMEMRLIFYLQINLFMDIYQLGGELDLKLQWNSCSINTKANIGSK